jgi:hypothetical protein
MEETLSVTQARMQLHEKRHTGSRCPCCGHYDVVYRRRITRSQVLFLADLRRKSIATFGQPHAPIDVRQIAGQHMRGGDYAKLALWNLIRSSGESGWWALTPLGLQFLRGEARIPKQAFVYRGAVDHYSAETIDVHEVAGEAFRLDDVLPSRRPGDPQ